jgi:hypothetical protein
VRLALQASAACVPLTAGEGPFLAMSATLVFAVAGSNPCWQ